MAPSFQTPEERDPGRSDAMIEILKVFVAREYVAGLHIAEAAGAVASTPEGTPVPVHLDRSQRSKLRGRRHPRVAPEPS